MNVRGAVEVAETAKAEPAVTMQQMVTAAIERQATVLEAVLPEHMSRARFEQIALAAIKGTPDLVRCFETVEGRTSVLFGVIQAASAGLEINSVAKEAWLIPREISYKNGGAWSKRWEASLQLDYRGVKKLARRSPDVKQIFADVVREGDHFRHARGLTEDVFEHEKIGGNDRELTHAYAIVRYVNGAADFMVLDREAVEKRRAMSVSYRADLKRAEDKRKSPWFVWPAEMWRKTAIHAIKGDLDLAPEAARVLASDDQVQVLNEHTNQIEGGGVPEPPAVSDPDGPDAGPGMVVQRAAVAADVDTGEALSEPTGPGADDVPSELFTDDGYDIPQIVEDLETVLTDAGIKQLEALEWAQPELGVSSLADIARDPVKRDRLLAWVDGRTEGQQ